MRVEFTRRAERDLTEIYNYLEAHDLDAAERIVDRVEARCFSLVEHAERGTLLPGPAYPGLRRLIEGAVRDRL